MEIKANEMKIYLFITLLSIPFFSISQYQKNFEKLLVSIICKKSKFPKEKISVFYDQKSNYFLDSVFTSDSKMFSIKSTLPDTTYYFNRNWNASDLYNFVFSSELNKNCKFPLDEGLIVLVSCPYENWCRYYLNSLHSKKSFLIVSLDFYEKKKNIVIFRSYQIEIKQKNEEFFICKTRKLIEEKSICK